MDVNSGKSSRGTEKCQVTYAAAPMASFQVSLLQIPAVLSMVAHENGPSREPLRQQVDGRDDAGQTLLCFFVHDFGPSGMGMVIESSPNDQQTPGMEQKRGKVWTTVGL